MPPDRPPRRPPPPGPKYTVEDLVKQGFPQNLATAVVKGTMSYEDACKRVVLMLDVEKLMRKHNIGRPIAMQIALGQADLEGFLAKRRMMEHREKHHARSCFDEALVHGKPMTFLVHGQRRVEGKVIASEPYHATIRLEDGTEESIHKLQFKAGWLAEHRKLVRKMLERKNSDLVKNPKPPIERPQDRYPCSDRTLFSFVDAPKKSVDMTSLEGEIVSGQVLWFGRYEIGMGLKGEHLVTVFRHALADVKESKG
jgi:hypothetical protein